LYLNWALVVWIKFCNAPSKEKSVKLLCSAFEQGITFFDTAHAYGDNEELLGEALASHRRKVVIATKFGFKEGKTMLGMDSRPENIRAVAETLFKAVKKPITLIYSTNTE
jgi:aryl-alcohol dehydrogenase-like predicted oxidoreductase